MTIDYSARYMGEYYKPTWTAALCILDDKGQRLARYPLSGKNDAELLKQVRAIRDEWAAKAKGGAA